jgi:hypothetical protein
MTQGHPHTITAPNDTLVAERGDTCLNGSHHLAGMLQPFFK